MKVSTLLLRDEFDQGALFNIALPLPTAAPNVPRLVVRVGGFCDPVDCGGEGADIAMERLERRCFRVRLGGMFDCDQRGGVCEASRIQ